jgi:CBS domain-containing protein
MELPILASRTPWLPDINPFFQKKPDTHQADNLDLRGVEYLIYDSSRGRCSMLVHEVMTTGVLTAFPTDSVRSAVIKMLSRHCGAVPVVDGQNTVIGLVALRDVMLPLFPNYGDYIHDNVHSRDFTEMEEAYPEVLKKKVEEVMSRNPLTVSPATPILEAASYMGMKNFRRIPVAEDGKLKGMVSIGDINRGLFFERGV